MITIYGEAYQNIDIEQLSSTFAHQIFRLITNSAQRDFDIIELRHISSKTNKIADLIVVDCLNDQVPTLNQVGIKNRERLALVFPINESEIPLVLALREDFPVTTHQNRVTKGSPADICLYFEDWTNVQRTWTAQKHLQRILWWLSETAKGTLHRNDQAVEQIYFESETQIILPPNFDSICLNKDYILKISSIPRGKGFTFIGEFFHISGTVNDNSFSHNPIVITFPAIVHCGVEPLPNTLGDLHDQLSNRGASFFQTLCEELRKLIPPYGIEHNPQERSLLVLHLPIKRAENDIAERIEVRAFMMLLDYAKLGEKLGILDSRTTGKYCVVQIVGSELGEQQGEWRDIPVLAVNVKKQITYDFARKASGIKDESDNFHAILAGVGALGSSLIELWSREAWGKWTIVDPDYIEPHNIVRHIAKSFQVGYYKVNAVKQMVDCNFYESTRSNSRIISAIPKSILDVDYPEIQDAINTANFLIDVTTTLYVPRDLSKNDDIPRSASAFLTPSGFGSALLIEDTERKVRLESLEAQYYRAIINNDWGENHLEGHNGQLWIGAGCRDISAVISFEMIQLHAATLARQIRIQKEQPTSSILIWQANSETGSIFPYAVPVFNVISSYSNSWRVVWDTGIKNKLHQYRADNLPNETGGVVVGYIDQKLHTIFVVDVLSSPPDSKASPSEFVRGISGLESQLNKIVERTANIVGYIGEWHSHPSWCSAQPSSTDYQLIQTLAETLAKDGQPALMIIVSSNNITITVQDNS